MIRVVVTFSLTSKICLCENTKRYIVTEVAVSGPVFSTAVLGCDVKTIGLRSCKNYS